MEEKAEEVSSQLLPYLNIGSLLLLAAMVGVLAWQAYRRLSEIGALEEQASDEEKRFADQVEAELLTGGAPSPPLPAPPVARPESQERLRLPDESLVPSPFMTPPTPVLVARPELRADPLQKPSSPDGVGALVNKLLGLRVITEVEGNINLVVPPPGKVVRLRSSGGLGAVIPRLESEAVMAHLGRKYEVVFIVGADGDPIVLQRYQSWLPLIMKMPGE